MNKWRTYKYLLTVSMVLLSTVSCPDWAEKTAEFTGNELKYWGSKDLFIDAPITISLPIFHMVLPVSADENRDYLPVISMFSSPDSKLLMGQIATHSAQALSAFGANGALELAIIESRDSTLIKENRLELLSSSLGVSSGKLGSLNEVEATKADQIEKNEILDLLKEHEIIYLRPAGEPQLSKDFCYVLRMTKQDPDQERLQIFAITEVKLKGKVISLKLIKDWQGPKETRFILERLRLWREQIIALNS
jgi:hypothetical protein